MLFICQDDAERDDFLARADYELTGHHWHPAQTPDQHKYIGRRHILFCNEHDVHAGRTHARRVAPYPPGHPARLGRCAQVREVKLPGPASETESRGSRGFRQARIVAGSLRGQTSGDAA